MICWSACCCCVFFVRCALFAVVICFFFVCDDAWSANGMSIRKDSDGAFGHGPLNQHYVGPTIRAYLVIICHSCCNVSFSFDVCAEITSVVSLDTFGLWQLFLKMKLLLFIANAWSCVTLCICAETFAPS